MSVSAPTYIYPPASADSGTLYQGFTAFMQANIPGWKPYSAELDDWIARAFTGMQSSLTEIASDVATSIYRWFGANIVGVPPEDATSATALITIVVQDANGPYDIPAFTQMSFPDANGTLQGFETTTDLTIPNGQTTATNVFVQAMTAGSAGNGCSGSGDLDGTTPITYITSLTMTTASASGTDAESDATYLSRLTTYMTTFTSSPITPQDFTNLVAAQPGVGRAITIAALNSGPTQYTCSLTSGSNVITTPAGAWQTIPIGAPLTGTGIAANSWVTGINPNVNNQIYMNNNATATEASMTLFMNGTLQQPGYVTTYCLTPEGTFCNNAAIAAAIDPLLIYGVVHTPLTPFSNTISVTVTGLCYPGTDPTATQTLVQDAITNFLQPYNFGQVNGVWVIENAVRLSDLTAVIMAIPGMHDVTTLTINGTAANYALAGIVPTTTPGTISVTLTNG